MRFHKTAEKAKNTLTNPESSVYYLTTKNNIMFREKQTQLFSSPVKKKATGKTATPIFVQAAQKESVKTLSGNGANKLSSTLDPFVDQFGIMGSFKEPRSFGQIAKDCEILWSQEQLTAVKFTGFLRTINRKVQLFNGQTTQENQKGAELKHESIMRMIWLSLKNPDVFWKNIGLFVSLGSWHDVFTMLQYDLVYNGWENRKLNWKKFGDLLLSGLENPQTSNLLKKYLPQIKANSSCKTVESQANTIIAKWICSLLFGKKVNSFNYKQYRQMKTSGTAHEWQKFISQRRFDRIDFSEIHGRALSLLVKSKFLKNQNLSEKYSQWVSAPETTVKYTGFVHELFGNLKHRDLISMPKHEQDTINKQFATLVEKGRDSRMNNNCNYIVVRDTSASMGSTARGTNVSCFNIAKSLALYFSEFLTGKFENSFIEFNSDAKMHTWKGNTPLEKWYNDSTEYVGSTNFESVLNLFAKIKKSGVSESEFPTGILCISDSEFNPSSLAKTNVESAKKILTKAGFSVEYVRNFRIVLWNLQSNAYGGDTGKKFETLATEPGTYYFSGYSASVISFLLSDKILTPRELFDEAMNQEVLNMFAL